MVMVEQKGVGRKPSDPLLDVLMLVLMTREALLRNAEA